MPRLSQPTTRLRSTVSALSTSAALRPLERARIASRAPRGSCACTARIRRTTPSGRRALRSTRSWESSLAARSRSSSLAMGPRYEATRRHRCRKTGGDEHARNSSFPPHRQLPARYPRNAPRPTSSCVASFPPSSAVPSCGSAQPEEGFRALVSRRRHGPRPAHRPRRGVVGSQPFRPHRQLRWRGDVLRRPGTARLHGLTGEHERRAGTPGASWRSSRRRCPTSSPRRSTPSARGVSVATSTAR